jgi:hypothetical protein
MPRINVPYDTSLSGVKGPIINNVPGNVDTRQNQLASALNQSMAQADNAKSMAQRASLVAQEQQFTNGLTQVLPDAMKQLSGVMTNTVNALSAIDQQQYQTEIKMMNNAYLLDKTGELQNEYQTIASQHGSNPAKMMEWVNSKISTAIDVAPSELAKLQYLENAYRFKSEALNQSFGLSQSQRHAQVGASMDKYVGGLSSQAANNPDMADDYVSQLSEVGKVLADGGYDSEQVRAMLETPKSQIRSAQVSGLLKSGRPDAALAAMADPKVSSSLHPEQKIAFAENAAQDMLRLETQKKTEAKLAMGMAAFERGTLTEDASQANKVSYLHFTNFVNQAVGGSNNITAETMPLAANSISAYFNRYNKFVGSDTRGFIMSRVTNASNPHEAAAYSMAIDDVINDDRFKGLNIASSLAEGNKKGLADALAISRLVKAGEPVDAAVAKIRESSAMSNPALLKVREEEVTKYMKANPASKSVDKMYTGWFSSDPVNTSAMSAEYGQTFKDFYSYHGDIEVAEKATKAYMAKNYQPSTINGKKEIMFAAPEIYFKGNMHKFESEYKNSMTNYFTSMGGTYNPETREASVNGKTMVTELRPIRGTTENQQGQKTYLVFDSKTGRPILDSNDQFVTYSFGLNNEALDANLAKHKGELMSERDDINSDKGIKQKVADYVRPYMEKIFTNDEKHGIIDRLLSE